MTTLSTFGGSAEEAGWHKKPAYLYPPINPALIVNGQRYPFRARKELTKMTTKITVNAQCDCCAEDALNVCTRCMGAWCARHTPTPFHIFGHENNELGGYNGICSKCERVARQTAELEAKLAALQFRKELRRHMKSLLDRLDTMNDQLHRATMVQNRSVHIIKQVCAINAREAQAIRADVAALLEACNAAMEWAAAYPLGIASTQPDVDAAADVYRCCDAALKEAQV